MNSLVSRSDKLNVAVTFRPRRAGARSRRIATPERVRPSSGVGGEGGFQSKILNPKSKMDLARSLIGWKRVVYFLHDFRQETFLVDLWNEFHLFILIRYKMESLAFGK